MQRLVPAQPVRGGAMSRLRDAVQSAHLHVGRVWPRAAGLPRTVRRDGLSLAVPQAVELYAAELPAAVRATGLPLHPATLLAARWRGRALRATPFAPPPPPPPPRRIVLLKES